MEARKRPFWIRRKARLFRRFRLPFLVRDLPIGYQPLIPAADLAVERWGHSPPVAVLQADSRKRFR